ncbi:hypothetical protein [Burkholderia territorii]|uniref:hypothetical protein n=1 Tax=Burkholderia territorii TaxID=1503055 RepID=UPI000B14618F|nr:hypothetical protein [Burkholderia territorii]
MLSLLKRKLLDRRRKEQGAIVHDLEQLNTTKIGGAAKGVNGVSDKKVLVVGAKRFDHVKCVDWGDLISENVLDFHEILLYMPALHNGDKIEVQTLFKLQRKFAEFLNSDGDIYVLGCDVIPKDNSWAWCPMPIVQQSRSGNTIELKNNFFPELYGRLKSWESVYVINPYGNYQILAATFGGGRAGLEFGCESYVVNRAGEIIAGRWSCYTDMSNGKQHIWPGTITTLPYFKNYEDRQIIAAALTDILGKPQNEGAPDWIEKIQMLPVKPIDEKIQELRCEIEKLNALVDEQLEVKAGLEKFKRLLYVSSFELEDLVAECLARLGAEIKPAKYSQEEFVMHWDGSLYLAECKGVSKSISLAHLRQLQDYVLKYEEDEQKAGKGILFGNAWRELHPDERDTNDRPIFPNNVAERAKQFGVSLVSTVDLFAAFSMYLSGEVTADQVLKWMTTANGVAEIQDLIGK